MARTSWRVTHRPTPNPPLVFRSTRAMKTLENQRLVAIRYSDALVANRQPGQLAIARQTRPRRVAPVRSRMALESRFSKICSIAVGSHRALTPSSMATWTWQPALSANGSMFVVTCRISAERSTSAVCRFSFPELARATSSRVVARRRYALTSPSSSSRPCTSPAGTSPDMSRALANSSSSRALIGVIGLRSSCAAIARKSSRARNSASRSAMRAASAVSRTVGPFAEGILPTAVSILSLSPNFHQNLWRGPLCFPARCPRTPPTAAPASLETRADRPAFRRSDALPPATRGTNIAVPAYPSGGPRGDPLTSPPAHLIFSDAGGFDQLQPNPGWVAERFKAPVLKTGVPARAPWVQIPPHPPSTHRRVRDWRKFEPFTGSRFTDV